MSKASIQTPDDEPAAPVDDAAVPTVGTGSYIAISCTVMALLVTFLILGVLFLIRWF